MSGGHEGQTIEKETRQIERITPQTEEEGRNFMILLSPTPFFYVFSA